MIGDVLSTKGNEFKKDFSNVVKQKSEEEFEFLYEEFKKKYLNFFIKRTEINGQLQEIKNIRIYKNL